MEDRSAASLWFQKCWELFYRSKRNLKANKTPCSRENRIGHRSPEGFAERVHKVKGEVKVFYDPTRQTTYPIVTESSAKCWWHRAEDDESAILIEYKNSRSRQRAFATNLKEDRFHNPWHSGNDLIQLGFSPRSPSSICAKRNSQTFPRKPLPRPKLVSSQITIRLIICVIQTLFILFLGSTLYGFRVAGSYPNSSGW